MDKKALNLYMLIAMVVGNMIGTGLFVLPASLASYGTISLFSWVYTAIGALLLALTFTHLNKRFPRTGGAYAYCRHAFGDLVGFVIATIYWFSELVSVAGITVASIGYLGYIFPCLDANTASYSPMATIISELTLVWFFVFINILGIRVAGIVQLFLTIAKVSPLIIIILFGMGQIHLDNLMLFSTDHSVSHFTAISSGAALTFFAFIGLEAATIPAENTSGPKDIFKATMYGTLISSLIYITCTFVLMGMIPVTQLQNSQFPFAEASAMLFGPWGALIIALFACISGIGALNVCIILQGQIVFAAARDNIFPHWFAKLSKRDVPVRAQLLSGIVTTLLLLLTIQPTLLKQFNFIALLASLLSLVVYLSAMFAELKFVLQTKQSLRRTLMYKSTIVALLAAAYAIWMISSIDAYTIKVGFLLIAACVPLYYLLVLHRYGTR